MAAPTTSRPATAPDAPAARPLRVAGSRETAVFRVAMALAALAVLDDASWHREPGTAVSDHLVSGLVPVALAAALAVAYPHLRAGLRAIAAIACGVLMVAAGIADGARHVVVDRLGGDDVTAIAAGLAGAVLVALGVGVLWRSRRRDGSRRRRVLRRTLLGVAALLGAVFVLVPTVVAIVATHRAREPVAAVDLGRPARDVTFRTADGLRLAGWYVPSRNGAAVVVSPGRRGPVGHARLLVRHGYGVLLFDRRGEGASEGAFNAYGWGGDADLKAAVTFLRAQPGVDPDRIGGLGLSVGGEMLIETAAEDARLRAVVAEGASVRSVKEDWDDPDVAAIRKPLTPMLAQTAAVAVLAGRMPPPDLLDLVGDIAPRALLLIRGLDGQPAEKLARTFYAAAGEPKALWEVPGAGHTKALATAPAAYERRVVGFFDRYLRAR